MLHSTVCVLGTRRQTFSGCHRCSSCFQISTYFHRHLSIWYFLNFLDKRTERNQILILLTQIKSFLTYTQSLRTINQISEPHCSIAKIALIALQPKKQMNKNHPRFLTLSLIHLNVVTVPIYLIHPYTVTASIQLIHTVTILVLECLMQNTDSPETGVSKSCKNRNLK